MAISSAVGDAAASVGNALPGWVKTYARDHTAHMLVVGLLLIYPGIYHFVSGSDGTTLGKLLLPSMTTMVALFAVALFAISFDFISGYTGYLSFGHSLFFGMGAFIVIGVKKEMFAGIPVLGWIPQGMPFMMILFISAVLAAILALLMGAVSFRLTGVYFAMITLGFAELATLIAEDFFGQSGSTVPEYNAANDSGFLLEIGVPYVDALTLPVGKNALKGAQGIFADVGDGAARAPIYLGDIPIVGQLLDLLNLIPGLNSIIVANPELVGTDLAFYLIGGTVLVCYFIMQRIIHSPFGRVMIAIRENEERAKAIGYNTFIYKMGAFAISAFFASVAGSLYIAYERIGVPTSEFGVINRAGEALLATIIGGIGTLAGPFFGYLFDMNLREFFGEIGSNGFEAFLSSNFPGILSTQLPGTSVQEIIGIWVSGNGGLYIGIVFVFFILFVPGGLLGTLRLAMGGKVAKTFPDWVRRRVSRVKSAIDGQR
ncbi:branched-chain amino acid ABC transporter permease [Salinibaculum salinum]|uniref:branched-chain amino acid ABC transporter permease n=1 Tax=Salinibaculum salinum TaxID=3131996 RepID=UPI0030EF6A78